MNEKLQQIGTELSHRRQVKGFSVTELSDRTKISRDFIVAMESGSFDFLPMTYVRAFLRAYAAEVGLDPDVMVRNLEDALNELEKGELAQAEEVDENISKEEVKFLKANPDKVIEDVKGFLFFYWPFLLGAFIIIVATLFIVFSIARKNPNEEKLPPSDTVPSRTESNASAPVNRGGASPAAIGIATPKREPLILRVVATDTTWLRIVFDDSLADEAVFLPGDVRSWQSHTTFYLKLGNAGGIELYLNGKPLGTPGKKGSVTNIQIREDGFSVVPNSALPSAMKPRLAP